MLLPPRCAGCGTLGARWCEACIQACLRIGEDECSLCGKRKLIDGKPHECARKKYLASADAWARYQDPLRKAIRRLKYSHDIGLGDALARHLVDLAISHQIQADLVVPVPLGQKRLRERGYNQAALLARAVSLALGLPYKPGAVSRNRETASQVGLSLEARQRNVDGAFMAKTSIVLGKRILLVDDVLTTGATLEATSQALMQAGARRVAAVVVSRA